MAPKFHRFSMSYQPVPTHDQDSSDPFHDEPVTPAASSGPVRPHPRLHPRRRPPHVSTRRAFFLRCLALLCACSLSIGSHFASYILGPLKSRLARELGTSNTEFSLLISAFSLNSTWTPLLGGLLASRLGTTFTSILATGIILLGQLFVLLGKLLGEVRLMAFGMFIFGLGLSPLSVVQETIIVRFFKSHGLGVSLALGLVAGKGAAFLAARVSYPLTQAFGPNAPFYVATGLAGLSVLVNLIYISASKWLVDGAGAELEASDIQEEAHRRSLHSISEGQALEEVAAKHHVYFRDVTRLGDVFWAYIGLNVLCGFSWSPFLHLASNLIQLRYKLTEAEASDQASYLLAGSVIFYPICGFVVDRVRNRAIALHLLLLSSSLTLFCYAWLALPPGWTRTALPGIWSFSIGHGFSPLLLVVVVPQIVPLRFVSTALGAHKSLEQAGSTSFQTFAGWLLDTKSQTANISTSIQILVNLFLLTNLLQFFAVFGLIYLYDAQSKEAERIGSSLIHSHEVTRISLGSKVDECEEIDDEHPSSSASVNASLEPTTPQRSRQNSRERLSHEPRPLYLLSSPGEARRAAREQGIVRRGEIFTALSLLMMAATWVFFLVTAWLRLRSKKERGGSDKTA